MRTSSGGGKCLDQKEGRREEVFYPEPVFLNY
jgi:hypothetical protein